MFSKTITTAILAASASLINGLPTTNENTDIVLTSKGPFNSTFNWYNSFPGACKFPQDDINAVVAVDPETFGNATNSESGTSPVCGHKIWVEYKNRGGYFHVVDKCNDCPLYGLGFTPLNWRRLVGHDEDDPQDGIWSWASNWN